MVDKTGGSRLNLTASLVVRNELGRYLKPCIEHLLEFCDQIVVLDDASDDGTRAWLIDHQDTRLHVVTQAQSTFYTHEGRTRQVLIDETFARNPTHVLSLDADEFVDDGARLRTLLELDPDNPVWQLQIEEVWNADEHALWTREDGGWAQHGLPVLWRAPDVLDGSWKMMDRKLACRRVPVNVLRNGGRAKKTGVGLVHVGWLRQDERVSRHARYAKHDGGRFHANRHLSSILWPDERVTLRKRAWTPSLLTYRNEILGEIPAEV